MRATRTGELRPVPGIARTRPPDPPEGFSQSSRAARHASDSLPDCKPAPTRIDDWQWYQRPLAALVYGLPRPNGRPRERWRLDEVLGGRIDAARVRAMLKADGVDLARPGELLIRDADTGAERARVQLVAIPAAVERMGVRLYLRCPRCRALRAHLFALKRGVECRMCASLAYGRRK